MAEKKKKKKQPKGMPSGSIQSRMPSSTNTGKSPKKAVKKKVGSGLVGAIKKRRASRIASDKFVLGEKLTKAGRARARRRKMEKKLQKMGGAKTNKNPKGTVTYSKKKGDKYFMSPAKKKMLGSKKAGKVRKGAVGAEVTEGGVYAKYKKGSKPAKSFRAAFKSNCSGGAKSFTWDGRSYSCKKK